MKPVNSKTAILHRLVEHMNNTVEVKDAITWLADHNFLNMKEIRRSFTEPLYSDNGTPNGTIPIDDKFTILWSEHVRRTNDNDPLSPKAITTDLTIVGKTDDSHTKVFASGSVFLHPGDKPNRKYAIAFCLMKIISATMSIGGVGFGLDLLSRLRYGKIKHSRIVSLLREGGGIYHHFFGKRS